MAKEEETPVDLYKRLVEGISDYAIYMLDVDGFVSSWNPGAEKFKGYTRDEILGEHFSRFYLPDDIAAGRPERALSIARNEGRFEDYAWRVRKSGERFWAHVVIDLIRNELGEPVGFAKVTRDISERREAESRMLSLRQANAELQQFVQVASHDLREPLRKVLAFSDLLDVEAGAKLDDEQRGYLSRITSATQRMQALLDNLLKLTKISSHGDSFESCALNAVLKDVVSDLEFAITERRAVIDCTALPTVDGDYSQLRQLFQNLISNALKYCEADVVPHIQVLNVNMPCQDKVCIALRDNGIGFEPEHSDRIFGIFQRLHTRDEYDGSGVGLAICKKICERHGGHISAKSQPGHGSEFRVTLSTRHPAEALA